MRWDVVGVGLVGRGDGGGEVGVRLVGRGGGGGVEKTVLGSDSIFLFTEKID